MLKEHEIPDCIVRALIEAPGLAGKEYNLAYSGRAIGFVRMAADALEETPCNHRLRAAYHAYAGISAARTSIDAAANWLGTHFSIRVNAPWHVDLAKSKFARELETKAPTIKTYVQCLGELAKVIDIERQRAQHRKELPVAFYDPGGWHLMKNPQMSGDQGEHCATLLRRWADDIEEQVCNIIEALALQQSPS